MCLAGNAIHRKVCLYHNKKPQQKSHDNPQKGKSWFFSVIAYLLLAVIIHGAGALLKVLLLLSFETDT